MPFRLYKNPIAINDPNSYEDTRKSVKRSGKEQKRYEEKVITKTTDSKVEKRFASVNPSQYPTVPSTWPRRPYPTHGTHRPLSE